MDEGLGALIGVGVALAAIYWIVSLILLAFAWIFATLVGVFGHPLFVLVVLGSIGALTGLLRRGRQTEATSTHDFATIGPLKLTADAWTILVFSCLVLSFGMYGSLVF